MNMHKNFGEWYRQVSIHCTDDSLKKRWAGVESWVSTIRDDVDDLFETIRIFRGLREDTSREPFLEAFRQADTTFAKRDNELEQQVLAGASLVHCVGAREEDDLEGSVWTAVLAATALEASGLHVVELNKTLDEQAREVRADLHTIAREQRRRRAFKSTLLTSKEEDYFKKVIATDVADHNQLRASFEKAFQTLLNALTRSESALEAASHGLRCADEETNILWWIAGGSSRDLDKPWSALKDAAPLVAAWELADLTDVALGPQDAAAILERALQVAKGSKSKDQALHVYVNAVPDDLAKVYVAKADARAFDLAPLSLALSKRVEGNSTTWQQFIESVSGGLKPSATLAPERVARQAYIEAMLFRTLAAVES
jgi:GTPase-associated system helical domain